MVSVWNRFQSWVRCQTPRCRSLIQLQLSSSQKVRATELSCQPMSTWQELQSPSVGMTLTSWKRHSRTGTTKCTNRIILQCQQQGPPLPTTAAEGTQHLHCQSIPLLSTELLEYNAGQRHCPLAMPISGCTRPIHVPCQQPCGNLE